MKSMTGCILLLFLNLGCVSGFGRNQKPTTVEEKVTTTDPSLEKVVDELFNYALHFYIDVYNDANEGRSKINRVRREWNRLDEAFKDYIAKNWRKHLQKLDAGTTRGDVIGELYDHMRTLTDGMFKFRSKRVRDNEKALGFYKDVFYAAKDVKRNSYTEKERLRREWNRLDEALKDYIAKNWRLQFKHCELLMK
ncbi:hypothetical protein GCK32_006758 [Trichostrongylus colubriformis]|uniref:Uncharacterized protein n=1 Tax=Trichostrongylus colubriformis TaxID=6319 RepID=A0AAN8FRD1_TRICO